MDKKYWVPALERAHAVLNEVARNHAQLKMSDLCKRLDISKSTMFSLLHTMEQLGWLAHHPNDTYSLGMHFGSMGNAFFQQLNLVDLFNKHAGDSMRKIGESFQMASLEGDHILYLAKETAPSPVQMVSGPGARFPAHATGLGKVLLSDLSEERIVELFPREELEVLTPYTISSRQQLLRHLDMVRIQGYAFDLQEGVRGFNCIAAPVRQGDKIIAALSVSMPIHVWEQKNKEALAEVLGLSGKLSMVAG